MTDRTTADTSLAGVAQLAERRVAGLMPVAGSNRKESVFVFPEPMLKMVREPLPMKIFLNYPDGVYKYPPPY